MPALSQRLVRRTVMLYKKEGTYAVDAAPAAAQAVPFYEADFEADIAQIPRDLVRQYFGASDVLAGRELAKVKLTYELAGSGTAGTVPQWDDLFQGLGFASSVLATPARVEYTPVSNTFVSGTAYCYADGVLFKALGCMATAKIDATVGKVPTVAHEITGLYGGESAATISTAGFSGWKTPDIVKKASIVDVTFGAAYAAGALTGGTTYSSRGLTVDIGNDVQYIEVGSQDYVTIVNRKVVGQVVLDITAAQEITQMGNVRGATTQQVGFTIGTVAGLKIIMHGAKAQLSNPTVVNVQGVRMVQFDITFQPGNNGNDDFRLALV